MKFFQPLTIFDFHLVRISLVIVFALNQSALFSQNSTYLDSLTSVLRTEQSKVSKTETLLLLCEYLLSLDPFKALNYSLDAESLAEESGNNKQLSKAQELAGKAYFYNGLVAESIKNFYRNLEIQKLHGSKSDLANAYANLGAAWLMDGDLKKAEDFFLQAQKTLGNPEMSRSDSISVNFNSTVYNNLSLVYRYKNELDKAEKYAVQSVLLARNPKVQSSGLIRSLLNYGEILLAKNQVSGCYSAFYEALLISKRTLNPAMEASALYSMSLFHKASGSEDSAILMAKAGYLLSKQINSLSLINPTAGLIYNFYSKSHNADSALKYSMILQENNRAVKADEVRLNLVTEELQSKFKQDEQRHKEKNQKERIIYVALLAVVIAFAGLATYYYVRVRRENFISGKRSQKLQQQKESMEEELENHRKELVLSTMQQLQKNEVIENVVSRLSNIESKNKDPQKLIQSALSDLKSLHNESTWKEFEIRFQQVDSEFYDRLKTVCTNLSTNERRLCALLKLNMASKEISNLTGQSVRSIEMARIRLRKKLNLTNTDINLTDYIASI